MEFDPIETCPYDDVHRIRRSRMQFHITTCAKNFPASKMMQCPFDARHKVNQVEFEYHKNHCPARESVINYALHDPMSQAEAKILPIDVQPVGTADEDWDEGANVKSYNPLQAIRDKPIVFPIIGLSKAKRKNHRLQERQRFNQIMENSGNQNINQNGEQSNSVNVESKQKSTAQDTNDNNGDADEETYKPLRRPFGMGNKPATTNKVSQNKDQTSTPENSKKPLNKVEKTTNVSNAHSAAVPKKKESPTVNKSKDNESNINDSILDELSKTVEEFCLNVSHNKKTEDSLDEQINILKKKSSEKKTKAIQSFKK